MPKKTKPTVKSLLKRIELLENGLSDRLDEIMSAVQKHGAESDSDSESESESMSGSVSESESSSEEVVLDDEEEEEEKEKGEEDSYEQSRDEIEPLVKGAMRAAEEISQRVNGVFIRRNVIRAYWAVIGGAPRRDFAAILTDFEYNVLADRVRRYFQPLGSALPLVAVIHHSLRRVPASFENQRGCAGCRMAERAIGLCNVTICTRCAHQLSFVEDVLQCLWTVCYCDGTLESAIRFNKAVAILHEQARAKTLYVDFKRDHYVEASPEASEASSSSAASMVPYPSLNGERPLDPPAATPQRLRSKRVCRRPARFRFADYC